MIIHGELEAQEGAVSGEDPQNRLGDMGGQEFASELIADKIIL